MSKGSGEEREKSRGVGQKERSIGMSKRKGERKAEETKVVITPNFHHT